MIETREPATVSIVLTKPTTIGARHYRVGETATVAEWQAKMLISTGQARIADLRGVYQTR